MSDSCKLPEFSVGAAAKAALDLFNLSGPINLLQGERDLNYLIEDSSGPVVFKIANELEDPGMLECQQQVFKIVENSMPDVQCPRGVMGLDGSYIAFTQSESGINHACRAVTYSRDKLFSAVKPHTPHLMEGIGRILGRINIALDGFEHPALNRPLLWKLENGHDVIDQYKGLIEDEKQRELVSRFQERFVNHVLPKDQLLRRGVIHNDANDNNILVDASDPWSQRVSGLIDFGDMVHSWVAAEPAVASAYVLLNKEHILDAAASVIRGYHECNSLNEVELDVLFDLICMRLCISVSICAYQKTQEPENEYLHISEIPAWQVLERLDRISPDYAHFCFRAACGMEPVPGATSAVNWIADNQHQFGSIVDVDCRTDPLLVMDTSVGSPYLDPPGTKYDPEKLTRKIFEAIDDAGAMAGIGRYDEYRLIYDSDDFVDATGHRRTLHLGLDIFLPEGANVYAPMDAVVYGLGNNNALFDYGGSVVLKHSFSNPDGSEGKFFTLYGHLNPTSFSHLNPGDQVNKGDRIARMGGVHENGYWPPHVHFEIITHMLDETNTYVGVGSHAHRDVWLSLCPDPNLVVQVPESVRATNPTGPQIHGEIILQSRSETLGPSLNLSYRQPIHVARGSLQYLFDYTGQRYLDAVNNVPHVGHCHPHVVEAIRKQAGVLNTNTRYLYHQLMEYTERLTALFPDPLNVCFLVNSGSEANDLSIRLARAYTQRREIITLDHGYHGNLASLIDVSPYKHDGKGGGGTPSHVHKVPLPDLFRNRISEADSDALDRFLKPVEALFDGDEHSSPIGLFMCESISGCGGQVVLPDGYLEKVYEVVRKSGGICLADEVQVGLGRVGSHMWAFETQGVVPDIVTLGKPIGNGHPLAAVITTREIAQAFDNGMEYFNTFGGNPVSCAAGNAVLDVMEQENLMVHAHNIGSRFVSELETLAHEHDVIGQIRGKGLFIGIELVSDTESLQPATGIANYVAERMKEERVLISTDGPYNNVLKIKPPMCFSDENVNEFVEKLEEILKEDFCRI